MSITIKLLVELNNEKYSVFVESDYKFVKFKTVSNEIITQLNQNISHKTHLFEMFDQDFGEYVLVTNENQLVENLSRIRVKTKDTIHLNGSKDGVKDNTKDFDEDKGKEVTADGINEKLDQLSVADISLSKTSSDMTEEEELSQFCDYLFGTNPKNFIENNAENKSVSKSLTIGSSAKSLDEFIENNLSQKTKELAKYLFNFNESSDKLLNKEINVDKCVQKTDDQNSESTDDTVVEASNHQSNINRSSPEPPEEAVNYLDLEQSNNYRLSTSCPLLYHKTFVEKFRKQLLVTIRIRYEDFKAIQLLLDFLDINRRCFQRYPSNDDPLNPKWKTISEQMVTNGFDDWTAEQCRDGFTNALDLYKKTLDKCPDYDTAIKVYPFFNEFHSFDMKYIISLSEFNVVRDLRDLFGRKLTKFGHNSSFGQRKYSLNQSLIQRNNRFDDRTAAKSPTKQRDRYFQNSAKMGSNLSLHSMSNGFGKYVQKSRSEIDKMKLKNIGLKVDKNLIVSFKALAESLQTITAQFGHVSHNKHYWELVSNQMKAKGYKTYAPHDCYRFFTEHVCDYYSLALIYSSDANNAQEVYPLFNFIHSMDLSQYLSYFSFNKIQDLRNKFENKTDFFRQMFVK